MMDYGAATPGNCRDMLLVSRCGNKAKGAPYEYALTIYDKLIAEIIFQMAAAARMT
jgi:hypothetical protein